MVSAQTYDMLTMLITDNTKQAICKYENQGKIFSNTNGNIVDQNNNPVKLYLNDTWYVFSKRTQTDFNTALTALNNGKYIGCTDVQSSLNRVYDPSLQCDFFPNTIITGNWYIYD